MLVIDVCKCGDFRQVKQTASVFNAYIVFYWLCFFGRLRFAKRLFGPTIPQRGVNSTFSCACLNGNLKVARWLFPRVTKEVDANAFRWACKRGHLTTLKWLVSKRMHPHNLGGVEIHGDAIAYLRRIYPSASWVRHVQLVAFSGPH